MFVDFVNMFADPTGFFETAPIWVSFVLPGAITGTIATTLWFLAWSKQESEADFFAPILTEGIATIFWGLIVTPAFTAHGVIAGFPLAISCILGWGAMTVGTWAVPYLTTKYKERYH